MSGKQEILFLVHRIPYPPNKGDKIRSWRLLRHLTERFDVHLGCFVDDPDDWRHEGKVRSICKSAFFARLDPVQARLRSARGLFTGAPLTMPYYADAKMRNWVRAVRQKNLCAEIAFSSSMAGYLETPVAARPRLVDLCDADSAKWTQYAGQKSGPMAWVYAREGRRLAGAEQAIIGWSDAAFAISADEAAVFGAQHQNLHWFGNGVDASYFDPDASYISLAEPADVVFVGAMDYWANVDAVRWFTETCWPRIRAACPGARFAIVGSRPGREVEALGAARGVKVTGRVEDVRPWLRDATLVIAPMRIARGVQNKVLEAMAMAKPVVATPGAAQGIEVRAGEEMLIAEDAEAFSASVIALLEEPARAGPIGRAARARIVSDYSWTRQLRRFDTVLDRLLTH